MLKIKRIIFVSLFLLSYESFGWSDKVYPAKSFDKPKRKVEFKIPQKPGEDPESGWCSDYESYAIASISSGKDCDLVEVRFNKVNSKEDLCTHDTSKILTKNVEDQSRCFSEKHGDYLFLDGEGLGSEKDTSIYKTAFSTGLSPTVEVRQVGRITRHSDQEVVPSTHSGYTSLEYYKVFEAKCSLLKDGESCWKKCLSQNSVPEKIKMADCKPAFDSQVKHYKLNSKESKKLLDSNPVLFFKVRVKNIEDLKNFEFLEATPLCEYPG